MTLFSFLLFLNFYFMGISVLPACMSGEGVRVLWTTLPCPAGLHCYSQGSPRESRTGWVLTIHGLLQLDRRMLGWGPCVL